MVIKTTLRSILRSLILLITAGRKITMSRPTSILLKSLKAKSKLVLTRLETTLNTIRISTGMIISFAFIPNWN